MPLKELIDFAVAAGTLVLALATFFLVFETRRGRKQIAKEHRQNLRPFCAIEFKDADDHDPFGKGFVANASVAALYPSSPQPPEIRIRGRLVNKGLGPAKDVVIYLNAGNTVVGQVWWLTHPLVVCGLIAAGEGIEIDVKIEERHVASVVKDGRRVPTHSLRSVAENAYEVVLRYKDIFENTFRTVHAKGYPQNLSAEIAAAQGDRAQEQALSIRQNRPTPVFLKGEQPWLTSFEMRRLPADPSVHPASSVSAP